MGADITVDSSKENLQEIGIVYFITTLSCVIAIYSDEGDQW